MSIVTHLGQLQTPTTLHALDALAGVERVIAAQRLPELSYKAGSEVTASLCCGDYYGFADSPFGYARGVSTIAVEHGCCGFRFDPTQTLDLRTIGGFPVVTVPSFRT